MTEYCEYQPVANKAVDLIPMLPRIREIREKYSQLEGKIYPGSWGEIELLDGWHGDIGKLFKLEMARRGMRKLKGVDDVEGALEHELADCAWSWAVLADKAGVKAEALCHDADWHPPIDGTPRQLAVIYNLHAVHIDLLLDSPPGYQAYASHEDRQAVLQGHFVAGLSALTELANAYQIDLPHAVATTMDELDERIDKELSQL